MLPACLLKLATEVLPLLLTLGVQSVEVAYKRGENSGIHGIQFRGVNGYRVGRQEIPLTVTAVLENCIIALIGKEVSSGGDGVVECHIAEREVVCRHTPNDKHDVVVLEWEL